ncbi:RidA family protein [Helicobacter sp. T3_23-1059]
MTYISTHNAPKAIGPYSQGISLDSANNGLIFTSGAIALTPSGEFIDGDIKAQTKQVMQNLQAILKEAGSSLDKVLKTTCYLANMEDFSAFNAEYEKAFGSHKPARTTIGVKSLPKNALVEVECIATK